MYKKAFTVVAAALMVLVMIAAQPIVAASYTITVQTNAGSYTGAQTLVASGTVSPPPGPGTAVFLKILNPSGTVVAIGTASVNGSTGSYQHSFVLGGSSSWVTGTYNVNASWGNSATGPVIFKAATFAYSPTVSTTTTSSTSSTTTSTTTKTTTSTTPSQTTTSTTSSTSTTQVTTTSTMSTTTPTTSSSTSSTQTTTSSSTQSGGGGIPEFPLQIAATTLFTILLLASYLLARRYALLSGRLRRQ